MTHLLELIEEIDAIEKLFHTVVGGGIPEIEEIYDVQEFQNWIQEVSFELKKITPEDDFIDDTLKVVQKTFNGWNDHKDFNIIKAKLLTIKKNSDTYFSNAIGKGVENVKKCPKIFISHSSSDKDYVTKIVNLLDGMGLNPAHVFCSSLPGYDIPIETNIFEFLRAQFLEYDIYMFFVHSENYYASPVSLNEMGAAWALKSNYISLLLPGFSFESMKGVVNSSYIAIKLDNDEVEVKDKLNQLYNKVAKEFSITKKPDIIWEQKRDLFLTEIMTLHSSEKHKILSADAVAILKNAVADKSGQIIKVTDLSSGLRIQAGSYTMNQQVSQRESARWEAALDECIETLLVKAVGVKGEIFQVTDAGYKYIDNLDN